MAFLVLLADDVFGLLRWKKFTSEVTDLHFMLERTLWESVYTFITLGTAE
jgi:hypothetical protein